MNHDVFISYSSLDKEAAQAICHVLEQNEIRCWMAPRNIPPGSDHGDEIDDAIKSSKVVVVIFSETAAASQWVKGELNIAFEEQKTIIPVRIDQTPLKGQNRVMLNKTHWIDAYPDYKTKFNDVLTAVALSIGKDVQLVNFPFLSTATIGSSAFFHCPKMETINLPECIQEIGAFAFAYTGLKEVSVHWATPLPITDDVFSGINLSKAKLIVPISTNNIYSKSNVWGNFGQIIERQ